MLTELDRTTRNYKAFTCELGVTVTQFSILTLEKKTVANIVYKYIKLNLNVYKTPTLFIQI